MALTNSGQVAPFTLPGVVPWGGPEERDDLPLAVTGFNIGTHAGTSACPTVPHVHLHLVPRRLDNTSNPRDGVRGVVPERQDYK
jgi:hypothetical protein